MKKLLLINLFFVLCSFAFGQSAPLLVSTKVTINSVTVFTDPYTVTGVTNDVTSNWTASDISAGDSLYLEDGSELRVYQVVSISSAVGTAFTIVINDLNNTGNVPVTGGGALYRGTTNYDYPSFTPGITETLQSMIDNRFKQRLDANLYAASADYVTTDSFTTFTNGATFASIPLRKTVWRTTTGSKFEKTSSTVMTKRSTDNGELARLGFTQSGSTLVFDANNYNKVRLSTGDITSATISNPNNYFAQEVSEVFLIGIAAGTSDVTITWGDVYGRFNGSAFATMPATIIPAQMTIYFKFRIITPSVETVKFQYVDGSNFNSNQFVQNQTSHGFTVGQFIYFSDATTAKLAKSDVSAADSVAQWVVSEVLSANSFNYCNNCEVSLTTGFTPGSYIWLNTTLGGVINTQPTVTNCQLVGVVRTTSKIYAHIGDLCNVGWVDTLIIGTSIVNIPTDIALQDTVNIFGAAGATAATAEQFIALVDKGDQYKDSITVRTQQEYFATKTSATASQGLIKWNLDTAQIMSVTLTANSSMDSPTNMKNGGNYQLIVKQNGTGGYDFSFGDTYFLDSLDMLRFSQSANAVNIFDFTSDGEYMYGKLRRVKQGDMLSFVQEYYDSLVIAFLPAWAGNEFTKNTIVDKVITTGVGIYQYVDNTKNVNKFVNVGLSSTYPTFTNVASKYAYDFDGTDDNMVVRGSRYLQTMQDGIFSLFIQINSDTDGQADWVLSCDQGGSVTGWNLKKNTDDTWSFNVKVAGTNVISKTTTATHTAAEGWENIWVIGNGASGGTIQIGNSAAEAFTYTPNGTGTVTRDIKFGAFTDGSNFWDGQIGQFLLFDNAVSASTKAKVEAANQNILNIASGVFVRPYTTFTPDKISGLHEWYDMSDTLTMFVDAGKTNNAGTNNDDVDVIVSKAPHATQIIKDATANAAGTRATYKTAQKNGRGVLEFASGDRYNLSVEQLVPAFEGDKTIFIVFKMTDTANIRALMGDNSSHYIGTTKTPQGAGNYIANNTSIYFNPADSTIDNSEVGILSAHLNKMDWNILHYSKRGKKYFVSANGRNWNETTLNNLNTSITAISHANSGLSTVGQIGEILTYETYLDFKKANLVYNYLSTKWGIDIDELPLSDEEDKSRNTLLENRASTTLDYYAFPNNYLRGDTMIVTFKNSSAHNDVIDVVDVQGFQRYNVNTMVTIGSVENVFPDSINVSGTDYDFSVPAISWLADGRMIFSGSMYDTQSSPGGRDTIRSVFRIRSHAGVYGALTEIPRPTTSAGWQWLSIVDKIHIVGSAWYVAGYGVASPGVRYRVCLLKSTNSGGSWSVVAEWDGNSLLGGSDPEEPILGQLPDGSWLMMIREDDTESVYWDKTTNLDDWGTESMTLIGDGVARPSWKINSRRQIMLVSGTPRPIATGYAYVAQRHPIYYISNDLGETWEEGVEFDNWRYETGGMSMMYGDAIDLGNGIWRVVWGMASDNTDWSNISWMNIKP